MKTMATVGSLVAILIMFSALAPSAPADGFDQMTRLTFNQPIQIPGHEVLPAGTYWFEIADHGNTQNAVVIYDADRTEVEAFLLTRPGFRTTPTHKTQLTLVEQSKRPDALLAWFYPGREYGHVFIYSNRMQKRLNEDTKVTLLAGSAQAAG
jgi:hypothetical protein